jgi:hypothetical protein
LLQNEFRNPTPTSQVKEHIQTRGIAFQRQLDDDWHVGNVPHVAHVSNVLNPQAEHGADSRHEARVRFLRIEIRPTAASCATSSLGVQERDQVAEFLECQAVGQLVRHY